MNGVVLSGYRLFPRQVSYALRQNSSINPNQAKTRKILSKLLARDIKDNDSTGVFVFSTDLYRGFDSCGRVVNNELLNPTIDAKLTEISEQRLDDLRTGNNTKSGCLDFTVLYAGRQSSGLHWRCFDIYHRTFPNLDLNDSPDQLVPTTVQIEVVTTSELRRFSQQMAKSPYSEKFISLYDPFLN